MPGGVMSPEFRSVQYHGEYHGFWAPARLPTIDCLLAAESRMSNRATWSDLGLVEARLSGRQDWLVVRSDIRFLVLGGWLVTEFFVSTSPALRAHIRCGVSAVIGSSSSQFDSRLLGPVFVRRI